MTTRRLISELQLCTDKEDEVIFLLEGEKHKPYSIEYGYITEIDEGLVGVVLVKMPRKTIKRKRHETKVV